MDVALACNKILKSLYTEVYSFFTKVVWTLLWKHYGVDTFGFSHTSLHIIDNITWTYKEFHERTVCDIASYILSPNELP